MTTQIKTKDPEKYEYARSLYLHEKLNQKQISERLQINPKTVKSWIESGGWDTKKATLTVSPEAMINQLMIKANEMMESEDFAENASATCAAIANLIKQIKSLKNTTTNNDRVQTLLEFSQYIMSESRTDKSLTNELIKTINSLQDRYIINLK